MGNKEKRWRRKKEKKWILRGRGCYGPLNMFKGIVEEDRRLKGVSKEKRDSKGWGEEKRGRKEKRGEKNGRRVNKRIQGCSHFNAGCSICFRFILVELISRLFESCWGHISRLEHIEERRKPREEWMTPGDTVFHTGCLKRDGNWFQRVLCTTCSRENILASQPTYVNSLAWGEQVGCLYE